MLSRLSRNGKCQQPHHSLNDSYRLTNWRMIRLYVQIVFSHFSLNNRESRNESLDSREPYCQIYMEFQYFPSLLTDTRHNMTSDRDGECDCEQ